MVSGIVLQLKQYRVAPGVALFQQIHPQIVTWSAPGQALEPEDIPLVAENKLTDPAYTSPAGPITPLDILYGHRPPLVRGNLFMAHRCGFTEAVLIGTLQQAGFQRVASKRRPDPFYDLWALATVGVMEDTPLREFAAEHIPA